MFFRHITAFPEREADRAALSPSHQEPLEAVDLTEPRVHLLGDDRRVFERVIVRTDAGPADVHASLLERWMETTQTSLMEIWTEVNLVTQRELDSSVLLDVVDPLVHHELGGEIETWFFFWEPELRRLILWRDPGPLAENCARLATRLDRARSIRRWYEGAHGEEGRTYAGEAEHYGADVWPQIQKDWMNGSELALLLLRLERDGTLTRPRDYHWQRHVHLFTNQLFGSWDDEIELCLRQALGYIRLSGRPSREARKLIAELEALSDR